MVHRLTLVLAVLLVPVVGLAQAPFGPRVQFGFQGGAHLGVRVVELTDQLREHFGVDRGQGVLVSHVEKDSPAEAAGLRAGDIILAVGDASVTSYWDLVSAVQVCKTGDDVGLRFVRERSEESTTVKLADVPEPHKLFRQWSHHWPRNLPGPEAFERLEDDLDDTAEGVKRELERLKKRLDRLERRLERDRRPRR